MRYTMTPKGDFKENTQTFTESTTSSTSLFPPWGIDRLNQPDLPLDRKYSSFFTGMRECATTLDRPWLHLVWFCLVLLSFILSFFNFVDLYSLWRWYSLSPHAYFIFLLIPIVPHITSYFLFLLLLLLLLRTLGKDIDVFIIDTGMDTQHIEFARESGEAGNRIVKNLYDSFAYDSDHPSDDNDDVGHGTHVAGRCRCLW
jgi:subtilisin family serine protease